MKVIDKFIKTLRVSPCSSVAVAILVTSFFTFCIVPAMIGALVFDLPPYLSSVMGAFLFLIFMYFTYFGEDISMIIGKFFKKICKEEGIKGILSRILECCKTFVLLVVVSLIICLPVFIAHFLLDIELGLSVLLGAAFWSIIMFVVYIQYGGVRK